MILTPLFVVFLIIVFVLVWLFVKTIDERKWLTLIVSIVLTPIVYYYVFYPLLNIFSSYHHQKHFDAAAWKEAPALRYEMSNEIHELQLFKGKTKAEVQKCQAANKNPKIFKRRKNSKRPFLWVLTK